MTTTDRHPSMYKTLACARLRNSREYFSVRRGCRHRARMGVHQGDDACTDADASRVWLCGCSGRCCSAASTPRPWCLRARSSVEATGCSRGSIPACGPDGRASGGTTHSPSALAPCLAPAQTLHFSKTTSPIRPLFTKASPSHPSRPRLATTSTRPSLTSALSDPQARRSAHICRRTASMPRRRRPHAGAARAAAAAAGAAATGAVSSPRTQNSSSSPPAAERTAPANAGVAGSSVTGTVPDGGRARASAASTRSLSRAAGSRNPSHGSVNAQRSVASSPSSATLSADSVATVRPPGRAPERAARRSRARARPETASSDGERAEDALEWGHLLPRGLVAQRLDSAGDERASAAGGGSAGVIGDRRGSAPEPLVRRRERECLVQHPLHRCARPDPS